MPNTSIDFLDNLSLLMEFSIILHFAYIGFSLRGMLNTVHSLILRVFDEKNIDFFKNNAELSGHIALKTAHENLSNLSNPKLIMADDCHVKELGEKDKKYCKYFKDKVNINQSFFFTYAWIITTGFIFIISIIQHNNIFNLFKDKHDYNNYFFIVLFLLLITSIFRAMYLIHAIKEVELMLLKPDGILHKLLKSYKEAYNKLKKEIEGQERTLLEQAETEPYIAKGSSSNT